MTYSLTNQGSLALVNAIVDLHAQVAQSSQAQKLHAERLQQISQQLAALAQQAQTAEDRSLAHAALLAVLHDQMHGAMEALTARVEELEYLLSEEIGRRLTEPVRSEMVAQLGHGWRIERRPSELPTAAATMCGAANDVHSPANAGDDLD